MRHINKGSEPKSLIQERKQSSYENLNPKIKDELRISLLKEQGHLCAYCMCSLPKYSELTEKTPEIQKRQEAQRTKLQQDTKIEHIVAQSTSDDRQLQYSNLVAVCKGNEGCPPAEQHCDTRKGKQALQVLNPTDHPERFLSYTSQGEIRGDRLQVQEDLTNRLNLNLPKLKDGRKRAWKAVVRQLAEKNSKAWSKSLLERKIARLEKFDPGDQLPAFVGMTVYLLKKRLARLRGETS